MKSGTSMCAIGLKAAANTCRPRGPYSRCHPLSTWVVCWQCEQGVRINASITTLPLYCVGETCPDGVKRIAKSGVGLGSVAAGARTAMLSNSSVRKNPGTDGSVHSKVPYLFD